MEICLYYDTMSHVYIKNIDEDDSIVMNSMEIIQEMIKLIKSTVEKDDGNSYMIFTDDETALENLS